MATETMAIIEAGGYRSPGGRDVQIGASVRAAVAGTRLYAPAERIPAPVPRGPGAPVTEVTDETSLSAARRLGADVACLVFASAKNPGGGFLSGAQAQEESIARSSGLYSCQSAAREFYDFHRRQGDLRYSDHVIYSPGVPVIRADDGTLLDQPYAVSFLTAAAPNLGAIGASQPRAVASVPGVLESRAERVLAVAAAHGHRKLVLGAWGCGVFRNDPAVVAAAFAAQLARAQGRFDHVVFAVLDHQSGVPTRAAFTRVILPPGPAMSDVTSASASLRRAGSWLAAGPRCLARVVGYRYGGRHFFRHSADLRQPGQGGPGHDFCDVVQRHD
jgi:uncharacterized protein (TIGR02452 family)